MEGKDTEISVDEFSSAIVNIIIKFLNDSKTNESDDNE